MATALAKANVAELGQNDIEVIVRRELCALGEQRLERGGGDLGAVAQVDRPEPWATFGHRDHPDVGDRAAAVQAEYLEPWARGCNVLHPGVGDVGARVRGVDPGGPVLKGDSPNLDTTPSKVRLSAQIIQRHA